jgi:hypothetical protein
MRVNGVNFTSEQFATAELVDSSTLELKTLFGANVSDVGRIAWQVVTLYGVNVLHGSATVPSSALTHGVALPAGIDPGRAWLLYDVRCTNTAELQFGRCQFRGGLSDGGLAFDRHRADSTGNNGSAGIAWHLVEFHDGTEVRAGTAVLPAGGNGLVSQPAITAVDLRRSVAVGGQSLRGGSTTFVGVSSPDDDYIGEAWATAELIDAGTVRLQRDVADGGAQLPWSVIQLNGRAFGAAVELDPGPHGIGRRVGGRVIIDNPYVRLDRVRLRLTGDGVQILSVSYGGTALTPEGDLFVLPALPQGSSELTFEATSLVSGSDGRVTAVLLEGAFEHARAEGTSPVEYRGVDLGCGVTGGGLLLAGVVLVVAAIARRRRA